MTLEQRIADLAQAMGEDVKTLTAAIAAAGLGVIAGPAYRPAYYAIPRPGVEFRRSIDVWFTPAVGKTSAQSTLGYITRLTG